MTPYKFAQIFIWTFAVVFLLSFLTACGPAPESHVFTAQEWLTKKQECEGLGMRIKQSTNIRGEVVNIWCIDEQGNKYK